MTDRTKGQLEEWKQADDKETHSEWEQGVMAWQNAFNLDLRELQKRILQLETAPCGEAAEMGFSLNWKLNGKIVTDVQMTMRETDHENADAVMAHFKKMYDEYGWHFPEPARPAPAKPAPASDTSGVDKALETGKAVLPPSIPPPAVKTPAPVKPTSGQKEVLTFAASKIVVKPQEDGKTNVEFWGPGRKYADLYCTQTVESLVALFGGGWTQEHFVPTKEMENGVMMLVTATYDVNLMITYTLSEKLNSKGKPYKDIVSITEA